MRVKKSIYNAISNSFILVIRSILMFVVRIVFVKTLGKELLGVDSLFTNLLLVLAIADSGMSTAISFTLYKPLADKNYDKVSALMTFYKKVYRVLGFTLLVIGLIFMPFIPLFVTDSIDNIYMYYLIYLLTTIVPYFIAYKYTLLVADQNLYQASHIIGLTYILMYILRITFLYLVDSFYVYALIQFFIILIQKCLINWYVTKNYKHINFHSNIRLEGAEQKLIYKSAKSIFINKLGYYLVNATDNIIISSIKGLGLGIVAMYTNYYSIVGAADNILGSGLSGVTSSFGDLAVTENKKTQENVFNIISFISFLIYGFFALMFLILLSPLISICFGTSFVLSKKVVLIICFNFYILGVLRPLDIIKEATGNYVKDRYANLIQAVINITLSIILGNLYGLIGVVLATLISYILVPLWNKPYIAYKYIFEKTPFGFYFKQIGYILTVILIGAISYYVANMITIDSIVLAFLIKILIVTFIYAFIIIAFYNKKDEFKYLKNIITRKKRRFN